MIQTLDRPCWRFVDADGKDYLDTGDGVTHFDAEPEARTALAERQRETYVPGLDVRAYGQPCAVVSCDGCGFEFDGDGEWARVHFPDHADARPLIGEYDWEIREADGLVKTYDKACAPIEDEDG